MPTKVSVQDNKILLDVEYKPAPEAQGFIEDATFVTGFFGPLGCGKTSAGTMKSWLYSQAWPGARIAVIRDTMPNLLDTTQKTFFEWFPENIAGEYIRTPRTFYLRTANGAPAEIMFRSMDEKDDVSNVLSLDLAAAWIDEPQGGLALRGSRVTKEPGIDHDLFRLILSRVGRQRGYPGMCWLTGNPPEPSHWIAKDFGYIGSGIPKNPYDDYKLYLGTRETNKNNLTPNYYERLERIFGVGTPLARRFLYGEWISFAQLNPFHAEWLLKWEKLPAEPMIVKIGFDPAISERDSSSRSALVVAGQVRHGEDRGRIYVLHAEAGHWSVYQQVEKILAAAAKYKVRSVCIEDVAYQRALKDVLDHEMRIEEIRFGIELIKPEGDKLRRASAWSSLVEDGTVLFGDAQYDLMDCLVSVPGDKGAWDLVDAAGMVITTFPRLQPESENPEQNSPTVDRAAGYASKDPQRKFLKVPRTILRDPYDVSKRRARSYRANPDYTRLF